jgi:hypothetical protein
MTNPNSPIIKTSKTRDGVTAFLHADGTVSHRLATFGFINSSTQLKHPFYAFRNSLKENK